MERAAAIYLRGQGREPATSIFDEVEVETINPDPATLTETSRQDDAPVVTSGEPVIVPPAEQDASGNAEALPEVPAAPDKSSGKGKAKEG